MILLPLTKCKKCGVDHGMGMIDTVTNVHTPIDLCYDCIFYACNYEPIIEQVVIEESNDYEDMLRKAQDRLIRDMMNSCSTPPLP